MLTIFQDISTAANVFGEVRKARKAGASAVEIKPVHTVPVYTPKPCFLNTIEGCQAWNHGQDMYDAIKGVFYSLPYETQRRLEFNPEQPGEWAERARFWRQHLQPVLPPQVYHEIMVSFIHWYAHCLRRRKRAAV